MKKKEVRIDKIFKLIANEHPRFSQKYNLDNYTAIQESRSYTYSIQHRSPPQAHQNRVIIKLLVAEIGSNVLQKQSNILQLLKDSNLPKDRGVVTLYQSYKTVDINTNSQYQILCLQFSGCCLIQGIQGLISWDERGIEHIINYAQKITDIMCYIHSKNVLHLDLKPSNILVKSDGKSEQIVKIIDFGESLEPPYKRSKHYFTLKYCPPEILTKIMNNPQGQIQYDYSYDVWSFGMLLTEISLRVIGKDLQIFQSGENNKQVLSYGQKLIQQWTTKLNVQKGQNELFFNIFKIIFIEKEKRGTFQQIRRQIKSFKKNKQRNVSLCHSPRSRSQDPAINCRSVSHPKIKIIQSPNPPRIIPVKLYYNYILKIKDITKSNLVAVLQKKAEYFKNFSKMEKLLFQISFLNILTGIYKHLVWFSGLKTFTFPHNKQTVIIQGDQNRVQEKLYFFKQLSHAFKEQTAEYKEFLQLLEPNLKKSKDLVQKYRRNQNSKLDVKVMQRFVEFVNKSNTIQDLLQFQSKQGMVELLKRIELAGLSVKNLVQVYKYSVIVNLQKILPREDFLNEERLQLYENNLKESNSGLLIQIIHSNLNLEEIIR